MKRERFMNLEFLIRRIVDHLNRGGFYVWDSPDTITLRFNAISDTETISFPNLKAELKNHCDKFYLENFKIVDV